eukprot:GHVN01009431.1.p1 GENE.GHVN01009431.1~~GHVN01009431.1.p1  ORF type:complete len:131 (+),score=13.67 GHVN01009431.1:132-524(+)
MLLIRDYIPYTSFTSPQLPVLNLNELKCCVYLDFAEAFDVVCHWVQLLKLQTMRERHQQYILVQVFKMIHGVSAIPCLWPYQEGICSRLRHEIQREILVPPHANGFNYFSLAKPLVCGMESLKLRETPKV